MFDADYYAHGCGREYGRTDGWLRAFGTIADRIISDIHPTTVLDAGCAVGLLVESLRRRGVEAYGVDISEYAIQNVHPETRPFCRVGSIDTPFPQKYDLIVTIEVVEHMPREQSELAIANLCQHSDDILFSSSPVDYKEVTHFNVQPPEYWAALFARHGFFRDVDFDASFITPWAARFRRRAEPVHRLVAGYERRLWHLQRDSQANRELNMEQRRALAEKARTIQALEGRVTHLEKRWEHLEGSFGWAVMLKLQNLRAAIAPPYSVRDQAIEATLRGLRRKDGQALGEAWALIKEDLSRRARRLWWSLRLRFAPPAGKTREIAEVRPRPPARPHPAPVDVVVCVHNALNDVQSCLQSVFKHTNQPYTLILVDDGSEAETRDYLLDFAQRYGAILLRNEEARGYTLAANQGMREATADYVILLNSDTIVTEGWLDRMVACAESDPRIGIVGPLSNTASWQSIPEIEVDGDWALNLLPEGVTVDEMGALVAHYSARLYPQMPLLNGFCLLIKRGLMEEIGHFDEEGFGAGYGEEDDYVLRARKAGWEAALADNVYIYHAQSRSYSNERRQQLTQRAAAALHEKHGPHRITQGVAFCRHSPVLEGIRARSKAFLARRALLEDGRARFAGRRPLFVLPITEPGGGANVIIDEALAMREMGVDAQIFNMVSFRASFERAYPRLSVPVIYGAWDDLPTVARDFEAVIASVYFTVERLKPLALLDAPPVLGYYIQGFEPYIYEPGTPKYRQALASYTLLPDLKLFTKTAWTRNEVREHTGEEPALVGASVNVDLFRPRPPQEGAGPERPLRVAAMIRPSTPYREPVLTMELLRQAAREYRRRVEIVLFGADLEDPAFGALPHDFPWTLTGVLTQKQVARLFNEVDLFVDFSSHQAMGLTALEAMACGVAVIVPEYGGATTFARHEQNSLVVDTTSRAACWQALQRLIEDDALRGRLQRAAIHDVAQLFPERSAFDILQNLFG
jgi:GT2 family glycosyltransferase